MCQSINFEIFNNMGFLISLYLNKNLKYLIYEQCKKIHSLMSLAITLYILYTTDYDRN